MKKIIKISSEDCAPCKMYGPTFDKWVYEQDNLEVIYSRIDSDPTLASKYRVMSVPTTILLDEQENVLDLRVWPLTKDELDSMLKQD